MNLHERKVIWIALSDFYLDTELQDSDFWHIAFTILDSPYTLEDVMEINKYEVFPVLQPNLLSVAGEWAGFNEKWLVKTIEDFIKNRTEESLAEIDKQYDNYKWMCSDYWDNVKKRYNELKNNPDSCFLFCRNLFKREIEPFDFDGFDKDDYLKMERIVNIYISNNRAFEFFDFLGKNQYHVSVWAAYMVLEYFRLEKNFINSKMNDKIPIPYLCIEIIENSVQKLKKAESIKYCNDWLLKQKSKYDYVKIGNLDGSHVKKKRIEILNFIKQKTAYNRWFSLLGLMMQIPKFLVF